MIENIRSVVSVNNTCVYFRTSGTTADEVHVCNGRAFAILPVYEPYQPGKPRVRKPNEMKEVDICFADVECSALRIDDASNADALLSKADEALVAGGFPTAQTRRERRRLVAGERAPGLGAPQRTWTQAMQRLTINSDGIHGVSHSEYRK